jgi:hypothetical protein
MLVVPTQPHHHTIYVRTLHARERGGMCECSKEEDMRTKPFSLRDCKKCSNTGIFCRFLRVVNVTIENKYKYSGGENKRKITKEYIRVEIESWNEFDCWCTISTGNQLLDWWITSSTECNNRKDFRPFV